MCDEQTSFSYEDGDVYFQSWFSAVVTKMAPPDHRFQSGGWGRFLSDKPVPIHSARFL
jgi:hypothetical protein